MFASLALPERLVLKFTQEQSSLAWSLKTLPHFLVVEDNLIQAYAAKQVFESRGIMVTLAFNGIEALEILEENTFDAVFMDVEMPLMGGVEATARIRAAERRQHLRSKLLVFGTLTPTLSRDAACLGYCRDAGMDRYIVKPLAHYARMFANMFLVHHGEAVKFRNRMFGKQLISRHADMSALFSIPTNEGGGQIAELYGSGAERAAKVISTVEEDEDDGLRDGSMKLRLVEFQARQREQDVLILRHDNASLQKRIAGLKMKLTEQTKKNVQLRLSMKKWGAAAGAERHDTDSDHGESVGAEAQKTLNVQAENKEMQEELRAVRMDMRTLIDDGHRLNARRAQKTKTRFHELADRLATVEKERMFQEEVWSFHSRENYSAAVYPEVKRQRSVAVPKPSDAMKYSYFRYELADFVEIVQGLEKHAQVGYVDVQKYIQEAADAMRQRKAEMLGEDEEEEEEETDEEDEYSSSGSGARRDRGVDVREVVAMFDELEELSKDVARRVDTRIYDAHGVIDRIMNREVTLWDCYTYGMKMETAIEELMEKEAAHDASTQTLAPTPMSIGELSRVDSTLARAHGQQTGSAFVTQLPASTKGDRTPWGRVKGLTKKGGQPGRIKDLANMLFALRDSADAMRGGLNPIVDALYRMPRGAATMPLDTLPPVDHPEDLPGFVDAVRVVFDAMYKMLVESSTASTGGAGGMLSVRSRMHSRLSGVSDVHPSPRGSGVEHPLSGSSLGKHGIAGGDVAALATDPQAGGDAADAPDRLLKSVVSQATPGDTGVSAGGTPPPKLLVDENARGPGAGGQLSPGGEKRTPRSSPVPEHLDPKGWKAEGGDLPLKVKKALQAQYEAQLKQEMDLRLKRYEESLQARLKVQEESLRRRREVGANDVSLPSPSPQEREGTPYGGRRRGWGRRASGESDADPPHDDAESAGDRRREKKKRNRRRGDGGSISSCESDTNAPAQAKDAAATAKKPARDRAAGRAQKGGGGGDGDRDATGNRNTTGANAHGGGKGIHHTTPPARLKEGMVAGGQTPPPAARGGAAGDPQLALSIGGGPGGGGRRGPGGPQPLEGSSGLDAGPKSSDLAQKHEAYNLAKNLRKQRQGQMASGAELGGIGGMGVGGDGLKRTDSKEDVGGGGGGVQPTKPAQPKNSPRHNPRAGLAKRAMPTSLNQRTPPRPPGDISLAVETRSPGSPSSPEVDTIAAARAKMEDWHFPPLRDAKPIEDSPAIGSGRGGGGGSAGTPTPPTMANAARRALERAKPLDMLAGTSVRSPESSTAAEAAELDRQLRDMGRAMDGVGSAVPIGAKHRNTMCFTSALSFSSDGQE